MQYTDESVDSTSKGLVSIMMSVSLSNKGKSLKLRYHDISRAYFQGTMERLIYIRLPARDRLKCHEDKVGRWVKSMYGTQDASHFWQLGCANRICGDLGSLRRGKHSAALFHNPNQDVRMAVHGDDLRNRKRWASTCSSSFHEIQVLSAQEGNQLKLDESESTRQIPNTKKC